MVRTVFALTMLIFVMPFVLFAAQEETEKTAETPPAGAETAEDPQAKWDKLAARKQEIAKTLADLRVKFGTASVEEKRQIRNQYQMLIDEFLLEISPEMAKLADQILETDPENQDAAEFAMQAAYESNQYGKAVEIADRMLAAGHESELILNVGGASYFAEHQFEKANELLTKAKSKNQLDPQIGGRYLEPSEEYIELWKKEQAIREQEANAPEGEELPRVELTTTKGKILIELFENEAPNTVANFISLVEDGFYDTVKFHRVINNFMIQGGDPNSKDDDDSNDGIGGPGYSIKCECFEEGARMHFSGSLSMAHSGKDTGGSQFFITHLPTWHLNVNNGTQSNHTVFGRVVEGLDVVRSIEQKDVIQKAVVVRKRDHEYKPVTSKDAESEEGDKQEGEKKEE